jgi:hypothetical protein
MKFFDRNVWGLIQQVIDNPCFSLRNDFSAIVVVILGPLKGGLNHRVTEIVM